MKAIHDERYLRLMQTLKNRRRELEMTQAELAGRLGHARSWAGKIENCELRLDVMHFIEICRVYGLRPSRLIAELGEEGEPEEVDPSFTYRRFNRTLVLLFAGRSPLWGICLTHSPPPV